MLGLSLFIPQLHADHNDSQCGRAGAHFWLLPKIKARRPPSLTLPLPLSPPLPSPLHTFHRAKKSDVLNLREREGGREKASIDAVKVVGEGAQRAGQRAFGSVSSGPAAHRLCSDPWPAKPLRFGLMIGVPAAVRPARPIGSSTRSALRLYASGLSRRSQGCPVQRAVVAKHHVRDACGHKRASLPTGAGAGRA